MGFKFFWLIIKSGVYVFRLFYFLFLVLIWDCWVMYMFKDVIRNIICYEINDKMVNFVFLVYKYFIVGIKVLILFFF